MTNIPQVNTLDLFQELAYKQAEFAATVQGLANKLNSKKTSESSKALAEIKRLNDANASISVTLQHLLLDYQIEKRKRIATLKNKKSHAKASNLK